MSKIIQLGDKLVGGSNPCYLVGEIGINHNGNIAIAKKLVDYASVFEFDCVKFQKRDPETCVPDAQKNVKRQTPWGEITYLEYRHKVEFGESEYRELFSYCGTHNIHCTASVWDLKSLEFMLRFDVPFLKVPSALITNQRLVDAVAESKKPVVVSTGMSTLEEVDQMVNMLLGKTKDIILCHCHSSYPAPLEELNLNLIPFYKNRYPECVIGYSGHEFGLDTTVMSSVLGACFIERHITTDRTMWGSDQMASVEPQGMYKLARDIKLAQKALGDGVKRVYDSEMIARKKLRGN